MFINSPFISLFIPIISIFPTFDSGNNPTLLNSEEISYFTETAFYKQSWLSRWEEPIMVQCIGDFNNNDLSQVNRMIDDIRGSLGSTPIQLVTTNGNLLIHFDENLDNFEQSVEFKGQKVPYGYMKPQLTKKHQIIRADIYIHPNLSGLKKSEVIRHEFCHSLGLMSHSTKAYYTENLLGKIIFENDSAYENWKSNKEIPILDKESIRILYQPSMALNTSQKEFIKIYT